MLLMAILVNHGSGVPQDKGLALDLKRRAAALSNPVGLFFVSKFSKICLIQILVSILFSFTKKAFKNKNNIFF
jgi:hypothetical protein